MNSDLDEIRKLRHPYFQIMELDTKKLKTELATWTREDLIDWLVWNDSNGVYRDKDSLPEFGNILDKPEAIEIIVRQLSQGDGRLE